jgi:hypothetical protein
MIGSIERYAFRFVRDALARFGVALARAFAGDELVPAVASLNSRNELPTALPISGSFPGPKTNRTTARIRINSGNPMFGMSILLVVG